MIKKRLVLSLLSLLITFPVMSKPLLFSDEVTMSQGVKGLSDVLEGCSVHSGIFMASSFQYSQSGNTIDLIQFKRKDGTTFAIPTNFESLDKQSYSTLSSLIKEKDIYWITFSVCGSGGFTSLIDLSTAL